MKRIDLRHLKDNFSDEMLKIMKNSNQKEVVIFLFEIGSDFSKSVEGTMKLLRDHGYDIMNSLRFNEVDWTIVVKKV